MSNEPRDPRIRCAEVGAAVLAFCGAWILVAWWLGPQAIIATVIGFAAMAAAAAAHARWWRR